MNIGQKLKEIRKELNLNQKDLAIELNITPSAVSRYESNERIPDILFANKLINELDINPDFIFKSDPNIIKKKSLLDETLDFAKKENKISEFNNKMNELCKNFLSEEKLIKKIKKKIERIKGITFIEKLKENLNGDAKRMITIFYIILLQIEKKNLVINDKNLNKNFYELVESIDFSSLNTLKIGAFTTEADFNNFKTWIKNEFDNISIAELVLLSDQIRKIIKEELWLINKTIIESLEKYYS